MFGPLPRAVALAALVLPFAACSKPVESTAPRYAVPEPLPPDPVVVAKEAEYREHLDAGRKAFDAKNTDAAITHLERATAAKPKGFEAHLHLARAYAAKKDDPKAIKSYGDATTANPRIGDPYLECATLLERAGRLEDARTAYTQLIREDLGPKLTAKAYWLRAELSDRLGKRSDYRYDRGQAMLLDPDYRAQVTGGDVRVFNHSDKRLTLEINHLVTPEGTERTFPPGYQFVFLGDGRGYLTYEGQPIAARSLKFTIAIDEKSKSYTATYEEGTTLEVHINDVHLPK